MATDACSSGHFRGREIGRLGHEVRLIPLAYVRHVVKRQKSDAADAEAICKAAQRSTMRFVAVKSEESQAAAVIFRTRDLLVCYRTRLINTLRRHLGEFGLVVPQGATQAGRLVAMVAEPEAPLPDAARPALSALGSVFAGIEGEIRRLEAEITRRAKKHEVVRRLMTIPGVGPLIATALVALAPPPQTFRRGRGFAAWLGLTPRQYSTGGKQRLGAPTKMGERFLRRLLLLRSNSVIIKRHVHAPAWPGMWLGTNEGSPCARASSQPSHCCGSSM